MELVAVGGRRLEQLGVNQNLKGIGGILDAGSEQGRGGRQADGQALPDPQQAERMRRIDRVRRVRGRQA